jgi:NAD-dependent deacetylase
MGQPMPPSANWFVLTGAGVSAESGLPTFRGPNGLWRNRRPEDVASLDAWRRDPRMVWEFYSMRRQKHATVEPNPAHHALAELERRIVAAHGPESFFLCTQNVDRLHERAGSERVVHVHGRLFETCCERACGPPFPDESVVENGAELPRCACGGLLRPNVCWFGETLHEMERIFPALERCDTFLAAGTSGAVYPVASFVAHLKRRGVRTLYAGLEAPLNREYFDEVRLGPASEVLPRLLEEID